jgi:pSer/pThr/pTyr-binding forkhead associated (FHA) protein
MGVLARLRSADTCYELEERKTTVGRDESCDIRLTAQGISRFHAALEFVQGQPQILDYNSRNGTFVNSERVDPGRAMALQNGDLIVFSAYEKTSYRFELPGYPSSMSTPLSYPPAKVPMLGTGGAVAGRDLSPGARGRDADFVEPRAAGLPRRPETGPKDGPDREFLGLYRARYSGEKVRS